MDTSIWPSELRDTSVFDGFTGEALEKLVSQNFGFSEGRLIPTPVIFWPMELYSFGKCYRTWLNWPRFLPIPAYGDHGIHLQRNLDQLEKKSPTRIHLTWSKWRVIENLEAKTIIHIEHPWVTYRKKLEIKRDDDAKGTIVYLTHSLPGAEFDSYDFEKYFKSLRDLPMEYHPIIVSMPMHDIHKALHRQLNNFNFPMVTAGNTASPLFVDRFYDLARKFKFATSNSPGSALFYCHELGLESFILGDAPKDLENSDIKLVTTDPDIEAQATICFSKSAGSTERDKFVRDALGLGMSTVKTKKLVRRKLNLEFIRLFPLLIFRAALTVFRKIRGTDVPID